MNKKNRLPIASSIVLLLFFSAHAQKPVSFYPYQGFHVGITGGVY